MNGDIIVRTAERDYKFHTFDCDCESVVQIGEPKAIITEKEDDPTYVELEPFVVKAQPDPLPFSLRTINIVEIRVLH